MLGLLAASALAWDCGPVSLGFFDGGLGVPRRACPADEVALAAGGAAIVETENFYGNIGAGARLDGSVKLDDRTELFGSLEAVRYEGVIGALSSSYLGLGATTVGATRLVVDGPADVGLTGRLSLPTAFGLYRHSWPFGAELGVNARYGGERGEVGGELALLGSVAAGLGPQAPRGGIAPSAYALWRPVRWFAPVLDVRASFLYEAPVDHVAIGGGLRFSPGKRLGLQLEGLTPLVGRERSLAAAQLRGSWTW